MPGIAPAFNKNVGIIVEKALKSFINEMRDDFMS